MRARVAVAGNARYCIKGDVVEVEKGCDWGWEGWERLSCAPLCWVGRMMSRVPKGGIVC